MHNLIEEKILDSLKIWLKNYKVDCNSKIAEITANKVVTDRDILEQLQKNLQKEESKQINLEKEKDLKEIVGGNTQILKEGY